MFGFSREDRREKRRPAGAWLAGCRPRGACVLGGVLRTARAARRVSRVPLRGLQGRALVPFPSSEREFAVEPLREDVGLAGTVHLISAKARVSLPARGPFAQPRNADGRGLHSCLVSSPKKPLSPSVCPRSPSHTSQ